MGKPKGRSALLEQVTTKAHIPSRPTQENYGDILEEDYRGGLVPNQERHPHWVAFLLKSVFRFAAYRFALSVTEFALYKDLLGGETVYYYCPRCNVTLERDYQAYCDRCGQCLDWKHIHNAKQRKQKIQSSN